MLSTLCFSRYNRSFNYYKCLFSKCKGVTKQLFSSPSVLSQLKKFSVAPNSGLPQNLTFCKGGLELRRTRKSPKELHKSEYSKNCRKNIDLRLCHGKIKQKAAKMFRKLPLALAQHKVKNQKDYTKITRK